MRGQAPVVSPHAHSAAAPLAPDPRRQLGARRSVAPPESKCEMLLLASSAAASSLLVASSAWRSPCVARQRALLPRLAVEETVRDSPSFGAALFGIAVDQSPWQYMLSMRRQGYGGITKVPLGPFGGDFYFLLEPEALKQVLLEDAEEYFPRRYSVPLFAVLELDRGIVYEQGKRHKRQKRLCIPSFEQGRSMASFLMAVQVP